MKERSTAIEINASADTVWAILTDHPFFPGALFLRYDFR
jgi:hypothetical protein